MASNLPKTIENIVYRVYRVYTKPKNDKSLETIGIDTESYDSGVCFMIATSEGDVFKPEECPSFFFTRKYRGKNFVAYNLKYDEGSFVQSLPYKCLEELRQTGKTENEGFKYKLIPHKCLTISRGKHAIHIYDMFNFYCMSLQKAAEIFLGGSKDEIETKDFTYDFVSKNYERIAKYCIKDSVLVSRLSEALVNKLEQFGIRPKRLYSIAYVSYQYFKSKTCYVTVKRFWQKEKELLGFAMRSYNGGKFEVTTKGMGYFYEYDVVSAYPAEIANLIDISWCRVVRSSKYRRQAVYGFIDCTMKIPYECYSPVAVPRSTVNTFPIGEFRKVITKNEYEYLIQHNADITIHDAFWMHIDNRQYPYKREIEKLVRLKQEFKSKDLTMDYHLVKILLNSLYGKMLQLIRKDDHYAAGSSWNPIYGSIITANVRCKVSEMQYRNPCCIAVHTDSVIATENLKINTTDRLGDFSYTTEGEGIILGSGVYQIGTKVKFRGFESDISLFDLLCRDTRKVKFTVRRPLTWKEVVFRGIDQLRINRFEEMSKYLSVDFDCKRIWLNDWKTFKDVETRQVESTPLIYCSALF